MKNDKNNKYGVELQQRKNVMINDSRIKKLKKIGKGNLSVGIRAACDAYEVNGASESALNDLLCAGQIKEGDKLKVTYEGERLSYVAEEILNAGTDKEEIILHVDSNLYFITSMVICGTSWAKEVKIVGT